MKTFNWLFVGCGGIAATVGKELKGSDNNIYAVYGRNPAKAEAFAKKFHCKAYSDLDLALKDEGVDGVYVCTTNDSHFALAKKCLEAHKPVLLEKPMTLDKEDTEALFKVAEENDTYLSEAMWTWYNATALKVKEWVNNGEIGEIKSVKGKFALMLYFKRNLNSRLLDPKKGGGCLLDLGVYPIRYAYELFGMPNSYEAKGKLCNGCDEEEDIVFHYPGFDANLRVSMHTFEGEGFEIKGSKGTIKVPFFHCGRKAVLKNDKGTTTFNDKNPLGLYAVEFTNVASEIRNGLKSGANISKESSLEIMGIMDGCRSQMGVTFEK